jgi:Lysylphosphatidylglycerol synthase TM region
VILEESSGGAAVAPPGLQLRPAATPTGKRRGWARLAPIALTAAIFLVIFWRIPFAEFWRALSGARLLPFLALMTSFSLCFFLMDTFVLGRMIRWFHGPLRYRDLLPVRAATYLVSIVNTQLAQAALALYIHRRFHTGLGPIASTVAALILLEATNLILFATAGAFAFPGGPPALLTALPIVVAAIWIALVGVARGGLGRFGRSVQEAVLLSTFRRITCVQGAAILALKGSVFLLSLLIHGRALALFGIDIPLLTLLASLPIVFLVAALPVTVAHLGTSQAAWIFFFSQYAPPADLLAYSLAAHLTFMLTNATFGLLSLPRVYRDLFRGYRADPASAHAGNAGSSRA